MSLMNRNPDSFRLRALAHELKANLETESPQDAGVALVSRVSEALAARDICIHTLSPSTAGKAELRARAQRKGVGRSYVEEVFLCVEDSHLNFNVSMWVRESERNYFAGSWTLREDLSTGRYSCQYSR